MTGTSSFNRIAENLVCNNSVGMEIYSTNPGSDNIISDNIVANNSFGMQIRDFLNTNVSGNKITSNTYGLGLGLGSGSTAKNNIMENNTYGFRVFNIQRERRLISKVINVDIDTSNTVNGKPIIYWVDQHGKTVPAEVCYVALIGCTSITVKNLDLSGNLEGVFLGSTTNSTIANNKISNNLRGVNLDEASNNTINGNIITCNENGINLLWNSSNNIVEGNVITENTGIGIYIAESYSNSIIFNNITCNNMGVYTEYCGKPNILHHNNFVQNAKQWSDIGFTPWPIPLPISVSIWDDGEEGNYWSDYNGTDADGDGLGDTPYVLGNNNTDHYPLMNPVATPEFPNKSNETEPFPAALIAAAAVTIVAIFSVSLAFYFKKHKRQNTL